MIQKTDLIILLTEMQEQGIDVSKELTKTIEEPSVPLEVLKFINDNRQLDVAGFYERIRKNHNEKRSNLYKNIVKEIEDPQEIIITLSAFALQIILYSKHVENTEMFFKHVRAEEVTSVLNRYYKTYNIIDAAKILRLIKADLKAFESIK